MRVLVALALLALIGLSAAGFSSRVTKSTASRAKREMVDIPTCTTVSCVSTGATCSNDTTVGDHFYECDINNQCNANSYTCTPLTGLGGTCTSDSDCKMNAVPTEGQLFCAGSSNGTGHCTTGFLPGADCTNNYDCVYYDATDSPVFSCVSGKCGGLALGASCDPDADTSCLPPNACDHTGHCSAAQGVGAVCKYSTECTSDLLCVNGVCATLIAIGSACNLTSPDDQCVNTAYCTPTSVDNNTTGKCVEIFTQAAGAPCLFDQQCGDNLACSAENTNAFGISTCVHYNASSGISCDPNTPNGTLACNPGEVCLCNYGNGQGKCTNFETNNPAGTHDIAMGSVNCAAQCATNDLGCISKKCSKQLCKDFVSLLESVQQFSTDPCLTSTTYTAIPGYLVCSSDGGVVYSTSAGSAVHFSLVVLVVASIAALL
eukprot:Phypoly_transcript_05750.p1 GENE.Phypoly_transcript_05750~~Phypoly_transcript_05750.p1  ORF type:complete len:431 (+),score=58.00 Phypoly_transcript_05750:584-1876(+)